MTELLSMTVERTADALDAFRMEFALRLETAGLPEDIISQLELCVYEVAINIIEHGTSASHDPISIQCTRDDTGVESIITYTGDQFDPTAQEVPDIIDHFNAGRKRGLGIYIIHTLMDSLDFSRTGEHNTFRMKKNT